MPEAASAFRRLEPSVNALSPADRARYALYRGLAHLGLGDALAADRWLSIAKRFEAREPHCFNAAERGELYAAWRSLGHVPGDD